MERKKRDNKTRFNEDLSPVSGDGSDLLAQMRAINFLQPDSLSSKQQNSPQTDVIKTTTKSAKKPHYQGHRNRLRQRFAADKGQNMPDYEILELLLFRSQPRKDTKPLAKALLAYFGSLAAVLTSDISQLQKVEGCGESIAIDLSLVGTAATRMLRSELPKRNIFTSWDKVIIYCRSTMAYEKREQFRILFLDKKNGLIADKVLQTGTVDHTPVYPREVIRYALDFAATSLILVHNHPSGDPTPSRQDVAMTMKLQELANAMDIKIQDHLIIGRNGYASLRELDLI